MKGQIKVMAMGREGKEGSGTWVDLGLTGIQRCEQGGEDSKAEWVSGWQGHYPWPRTENKMKTQAWQVWEGLMMSSTCNLDTVANQAVSSRGCGSGAWDSQSETHNLDLWFERHYIPSIWTTQAKKKKKGLWSTASPLFLRESFKWVMCPIL